MIEKCKFEIDGSGNIRYPKEKQGLVLPFSLVNELNEITPVLVSRLGYPPHLSLDRGTYINKIVFVDDGILISGKILAVDTQAVFIKKTSPAYSKIQEFTRRIDSLQDSQITIY